MADVEDPLAELKGAAVVIEATAVIGMVHLSGRVLLQRVQGRRSLSVMTEPVRR